MVSKARSLRIRCALRLEVLDDRTLLSGGVAAGLPSGPVLPAAEIAAANHLLIKFRPGTTQADESVLLAATRTTVLSTFPDGPTVVQGVSGFDPSMALGQFQASPLVAYAEPDAVIT